MRRQQLLQATLTVLARDGAAGVTHRAVAEQAGASLASASYHFAGIDDLVLATLLHATDELATRLLTEKRDLPTLARIIASEISERPGLLVAEYELYLMAVRKPHLRAPATAWLDVLADHFAAELGPNERRAFQATVDGVFLHALLADDAWSPKRVEATLRAAWPGRSG